MAHEPRKKAAEVIIMKAEKPGVLPTSLLYAENPAAEQTGMAFEVDEEGVINFLPFIGTLPKESKPEISEEDLERLINEAQEDMPRLRSQAWLRDEAPELHEHIDESDKPYELTRDEMLERYRRMNQTSRGWKDHLLNNLENMSPDERRSYYNQIKIYEREMSDMRQTLRIPIDTMDKIMNDLTYEEMVPEESQLPQGVESLEAIYNAMQKLKKQKENK